jgi:hypothetical protein
MCSVSSMVFCTGYDKMKRESNTELNDYEILMRLHERYKKKPNSLRAIVAKRLLTYSENFEEQITFELEELLLTNV